MDNALLEGAFFFVEVATAVEVTHSPCEVSRELQERVTPCHVQTLILEKITKGALGDPLQDEAD